MPESDPVDPEIHGLLRHPQHTPHAEAAWQALQQYRSEALAGGRDGADRQAKEPLIAEVREGLRSRLLHPIQNGDTAGPAVQYVVQRTLAVREHADVLTVPGKEVLGSRRRNLL